MNGVGSHDMFLRYFGRTPNPKCEEPNTSEVPKQDAPNPTKAGLHDYYNKPKWM